ncbi:hypothetical protein BB560_001155 [Smittium megazygosporum]|uniref:Ubiquitin carboxyl-terminal hydrolase n=1 Tax=Smittium megazygosporum TaxID=133381 RepID=A0A2T9ZIC6_9FUNG|nr:hypothetical protein BB560_001155 [Smittium megazygosporum]
MTQINIVVKWNGKKFDVEIDTEESGQVLKSIMFSLTGVEPDRQKILIRGKTLKDDDPLSSYNIAPKQVLMMMGSLGESLKAPEQPIKFIEDMSYEELNKSLKQPPGLINLGNTCYMSATIQCLLSIKELTSALNNNQAPKQSSDLKVKLTHSLRDLFESMNKKEGDVMPHVFLSSLRAVYPQFSEKDPRHNMYKQQDADECWNGILSAVDQGVKTENNEPSFVSSHLRGEIVTTYSCIEAPDEPKTEHKEIFGKIDCRIDKTVNYLQQGIKLSLSPKITKHSPTLNRDAEYMASSSISRLPVYLTVHYLRFFWKAKEAVDAKILKNVKFPFELDMSEFCTKELAEKVRPVRQHLLKLKEEKEERFKRQKIAKISQVDDPTADSSSAGVSGANPGKSEKSGESSLVSASLDSIIDESLKQDVGCNPSGLYDLVAVLTHIGRNANSGHYIAWVRKMDIPEDASAENSREDKPKESYWYKFDDDKVSIVNESEIYKLMGGGDWHTAYITLYKAKPLE